MYTIVSISESQVMAVIDRSFYRKCRAYSLVKEMVYGEIEVKGHYDSSDEESYTGIDFSTLEPDYSDSPLFNDRKGAPPKFEVGPEEVVSISGTEISHLTTHQSKTMYLDEQVIPKSCNNPVLIHRSLFRVTPGGARIVEPNRHVYINICATRPLHGVDTEYTIDAAGTSYKPGVYSTYSLNGAIARCQPRWYNIYNPLI